MTCSSGGSGVVRKAEGGGMGWMVAAVTPWVCGAGDAAAGGVEVIVMNVAVMAAAEE